MFDEHVLYTVSRDKDFSEPKKELWFLFPQVLSRIWFCDDSKFLNQNTIQC